MKSVHYVTLIVMTIIGYIALVVTNHSKEANDFAGTMTSILFFIAIFIGMYYVTKED